jgi:predicted AlkP superfamily phosphohydrolase/phosphomutase
MKPAAKGMRVTIVLEYDAIYSTDSDEAEDILAQITDATKSICADLGADRAYIDDVQDNDHE